jgi:hypothetical protein
MRVLTCFAVLVFLGAGCAGGTKPERLERGVALPEGGQRGEVRLVRPEGAVLDSLAEDYAIRDFSFRGGATPRLRATVVNVRPDRVVSFDISALFLDAGGMETDRKPWQRVTLPPGKRHFFLATTLRGDSTSAELLVKPAGSP